LFSPAIASCNLIEIVFVDNVYEEREQMHTTYMFDLTSDRKVLQLKLMKDLPFDRWTDQTSCLECRQIDSKNILDDILAK
jgi:hypothetical protein